MTLRKKCPYSKLFWAAFFPHFPVFNPNAGKYGKNADQNNSEYAHFLRSVRQMIRNEGSEITRYMSGSITFRNILSIRVLEWLVLLVGCKIKGKHEQENLKIQV